MHRLVIEKIVDLIEHLRIEAAFGINPDGCFYCGQNHPTTRCHSPERFEFYDFLSECSSLDWDSTAETVTELMVQ